VDYSEQIKNVKVEGGWKSSRINTDNLADYEYLDGITWKSDPGRSNHFLYREYIHAFYASAETKTENWNMQGGLRYEMTNYDADQLGNSVVKDSSFSRKYNSLFPSLALSWEADSLNSFSFSAGRRIDRPAFQKLNPFLFIINKYTYQVGNPFYRPQYTWNFELTHMYKNMLVSGISYSETHDYFSQIFPIDSNGIVLYTEGNLGKMRTVAASIGLQLSPVTWWSLNAQVVFSHKKMEGAIDKAYEARINQAHVNLNNQFRFNKGWSAELSGFYTSKSQHDIQEIVDPAGQLSIGFSKNVLQNKGTIRLAARDLFYTQWMKGNTYFTGAHEYFKLTRDTRVLTLSLVYRFGKSFKTIKHSQGAAGEEMQRVGNG
jgi:outer membrane receptor protein involved in Fe transport